MNWREAALCPSPLACQDVDWARHGYLWRVCCHLGHLAYGQIIGNPLYPRYFNCDYVRYVLEIYIDIYIWLLFNNLAAVASMLLRINVFSSTFLPKFNSCRGFHFSRLNYRLEHSPLEFLTTLQYSCVFNTHTFAIPIPTGEWMLYKIKITWQIFLIILKYLQILPSYF